MSDENTFKYRPADKDTARCGICKHNKLGNCTLHGSLISEYGLCDDFISTKSLKSIGSGVRFVSENTVRGMGIIFDTPDLTGEIFTKNTDFALDRSLENMPVYYDHALGGLKSQIGHVTAYNITDEGIELELELYKSNQYWEVVRDLVDAGVIGMSTGSAPHLVSYSGKNITRWVLAEVSLTPTPAEYRTIQKDTIDDRLGKIVKSISTIVELLEEKTQIG